MPVNIAANSRISITDTFVTKVLGWVLVAAFAVLAIPVTLVAYVFIDVILLLHEDNVLAFRIIDAFHWYTGLPQSIGGPILQVVPAIIAAVCFSSNNAALTLVGRIFFLLIIYMIALSALELLFINPDNPDLSPIYGERTTLELFNQTASFTLNTTLVYFGLITGLTVKIK